MGGIPFQMQEDEVRSLCESFGKLKSFNLIKDNTQVGINKGYAFFEYQDERAIDKAIKALNQLEIKDKRLKVQRAAEGLQKNAAITMHRAVPDDK
jgi:RNA recognition motif-containing protein